MHTSSFWIPVVPFISATLLNIASAYGLPHHPSKPIHTFSSGASSASSVLIPQFFPEHASERRKISYGPYTVPSIQVNGGMLKIKEIPIVPPCTGCLVTWMQAGLEFADGTVANADHGMWLHHTIVANRNRNSVVCPQKQEGERFFASGNERTPANICVDGTKKAGYYISQDDNFAMVADLMSMAEEPHEVVLTFTYEYIPFIPKGFSRVNSLWLDIGGCHSSSFPAEEEAAFEYSSPSWKIGSSGDVLFTVNHLHDGATHLELVKNGMVVCLAEAVYGHAENLGSETHNQEHISSIPACRNLGLSQVDDHWKIIAHYNTSKHRPMTNMEGSLEPVMGISLVYVTESLEHIPEPDPGPRQYHNESGTLNIVLACGILVGVIGLGTCWAKGRPRQRNEWVRDVDDKYQPTLSEEYHDEEPRSE